MDRNHTKNRPSPPPQAVLLDMALGFMRSQVIHTAAELGIADILQKGPKSLAELARASGTQPDALERLMQALIALGIFRLNNGKYTLNPMGEALAENVPMSFRPFARLLGDKAWWAPWGDLLHSILSGKSGFREIFGLEYTDYLTRNAKIGHISSQTMESVAAAHNPAILQAYDFGKFKKIIDVGGGYGSLISAILAKFPQVEAVLYDLPQVVRNATQEIQKMGGDFNKNVPAGGDLYILKQILHDWNDDVGGKILKNCRRGMAENGRLLVIENLMEPENINPVAALFDLHMLLLSDGRERTLDQYRRLLDHAGFKLTTVLATATSFFLIEAKPA